MVNPRFGIAEWYGRPVESLSDEERLRLAERQLLAKKDRTPIACPFLSRPDKTVACWKDSGVCSIRRYEMSSEGSHVMLSTTQGGIRTTCPSRFEERGEISDWIGEVVLGNKAAVSVGQMGFLKPTAFMGEPDTRVTSSVGRIDKILMVPRSSPLEWCAVEIQAVYFSGDSMRREYEALVKASGRLGFPAGKRRPDYRSSGPKRLMPQLQIKVPTLRTWGKKTAVVVDEDFFRNLGAMTTGDDLSSAEIAWFVVRYDLNARLQRGSVYYTTLTESSRALTAGRPPTKEEFESAIIAKLATSGPSPLEVPADEKFRHEAMMRALHRNSSRVEAELLRQRTNWWCVVISHNEVALESRNNRE
jgi:hypothetical protein